MFYPVYAGEFEQRAKYLAFTLTVKSATIITMPPIQRKGIPDWVFIITVVLFVGAVVFGVWAFSGRENYKNNVNQKINLAVAAARSQTQAADASKYAAESADPLKTYVGPQVFGTITVQYPKTWSAYISEDDTASTPIDGYFQPDYIPNITTGTNSIALRVQVIEQPYSSELSQYTGQTQSGQVSVTPYTLPKLPSVQGVEITGQIEQNQTGTMVMMPLRNQTLELWTESSQYLSDFNNIILPNFTFSP